MIPLIEEKVDINYMDSSAWDRFVGFTRQVFSLSRRAGLEQEGPTAVERYLSHQFPEQCVLGDPARLTLRLDVRAPRGGEVVPKVSLEFEEGEERVRLVALVRSPGFHVKPDYGIMEVPLDGPSSEVEFTLTPRDLGEQNVEVTLLRDTEPVGHTCLNVNVVAQGHASGQANASVLDGTSNRDLLRLGETRALVWVEWREDGRLAYRVRDPTARAEELAEVGVSPGAVPRAQVAGWAGQQGEIIKGYLKEDYATAGELEGALAGIASIGHELFKQLAPPELAELAQGWEPGSIIAVDSNEGWVPWELLSDSPTGPLWGERFQLIRVPRVPSGPALNLARVVDVGACASPYDVVGKIASVVGDGIERGDRPGEYSARRTFGRAAPLVSELIEAEYPEFFGQVSDADIVHFTCHGRGTPYHLSLGPSAGKRLLIGQVETLRLKPGVVIFANACSSSQPELFLSEFQNFGWSFYLRGARPFIGTLGPVPTRHAITFAQHFYERFIVKGLPAGRALREAKRAVAKEFRNPFYLFYCLYGPASVRRRIHPSAAV